MCISAPKVGATAAPSPSQLTADQLQLGTSALQARQGTVLGRLALTSRRTPAPPAAGTPTGGTTSGIPAGTLGFAPGSNTPGGSVSNPATAGRTPFIIPSAGIPK